MPKYRVEPARYDTLAMLIVEGISAEEIAEQMSLSTEVVSDFMHSGAPENFKKLLEGYRKKVTNAAVDRRHRFITMADKAYRRIEESLDSTDARLASDNAWKVVNEVAPKAEAPGVSITANLTQNNQVNAQIVDSLGGIMDIVKGMKKKGSPAFSKHLKQGTEALPAAYQQAESERNDSDVIDVETEDVAEGEPSARTA